MVIFVRLLHICGISPSLLAAGTRSVWPRHGVAQVKVSSQPWEPMGSWEHGCFVEKFLYHPVLGTYKAARVISHNLNGVSWFTYEPDGKLLKRGTAATITLAQYQVDNDAQNNTNASSRKA